MIKNAPLKEQCYLKQLLSLKLHPRQRIPSIRLIRRPETLDPRPIPLKPGSYLLLQHARAVAVQYVYHRSVLHRRSAECIYALSPGLFEVFANAVDLFFARSKMVVVAVVVVMVME